MHRLRTLAGDVAIAALLALAATWLYSRTLLGRIYGNDGAMLADWTAFPERAYWQYHNTLYLPIARAIDAVLPRGWITAPGDPLAVAKATSVLCGALALACVYACCRRLGAPRAASAFGTALLAVSPVLWFFAAAIEVHTQHLLVVSTCAFGTLLLPWRSPVPAVALAALLFVLPCLSHQSAPVLGPGWILLCQCARRRTGPPFSWPALFGIGLALLAAVVVGHVLVQHVRGLGAGVDFGGLAETVAGWRRAFVLDVVWEALLAPLGLLLPLLLAAWCAGIDRWWRAAAMALLVPLGGCVLWWGVAERGGYLLGPAFAIAASVAALWARLPRRPALALAALALVAQGTYGFVDVRGFDAEGFQLEQRIARLREHLGPTGLVVSANDNAPNAQAWLPGVQEINLFPTLAKPVDAEVWLAALRPLRDALLGADRVVVDVSWRRRTDLPAHVVVALDRFTAVLADEHRVTELDDPSWPLLRLERR